MTAPENGEKMKKFEGPITIEQAFNVDGRRLVVTVTFPGPVAAEIGMDATLVAANRAIVMVESKNHKVEKVRRE
ncbi:MAG: hypothetical protein ACYDCK_08405 [Thermoplasmatota archaeon]